MHKKGVWSPNPLFVARGSQNHAEQAEYLQSKGFLTLQTKGLLPTISGFCTRRRVGVKRSLEGGGG